MNTTESTSPLLQPAGPLRGLRVIELAGIGPGPFAAMLLSDMGADVVRIDRPGAGVRPPFDVVSRGRRVVEIDLRSPGGAQQALTLLERADALLEGFRPGVMERLGLGPAAVWQRNPRLVYGRMTGWGQDGPLAATAGHDIDYIALSGALATLGPAGAPPLPPMNLVGDYGGGSLYLVMGMLAALLEARSSGLGQVVDAAVLDGSASLLALYAGRVVRGDWLRERGANMLDGAPHYYRCYETADGRFMAVGAIEPQFYATLCERLGIDPASMPQQDRARWAHHADRLAALFRTATQAEWITRFEGSDACVSPVLPMDEAAGHPHVAHRRSYTTVDGVLQPNAAPRFSRSGQAVQGPPPATLSTPDDILAHWA
ncbi:MULTISPECIES: CaiB/BaiF CoA transferase family protein [Ramlibacter]|uniref:CoA transferase n=1 Tax=Ramlibacter pinisoli TaxID=2682844 RepID=A0A6N8IZZ4_9BURK|nr:MULTISPECIES: CaiB/BaiF CoA-transferase family protein [Ramlibacter]MBA2962669.1 CoA transferase [Ramlibacter sp. CGMCC 1.13660]MVQ32611.1 CoA transferase [Ramlibacter pinisoli]